MHKNHNIKKALKVNSRFCVIAPVEILVEASEKDTLDAVKERSMDRRLYLPTDEPNLLCPKCPRSFLKRQYLRRHLVSMHGMLMCKNCKTCHEKDEVHSCKSSENEARINSVFVCDVCEFKAPTEFEVVMHNIESHGL